MYKKIISTLSKTKHADTHEKLSELFVVPQRDKKDEAPQFHDFKPDFTQQADLLHLPKAVGGYQYLLVVVDDYSRKFDCEPMKGRDALDTKRAFERLYARGELKMPKVMEVDDGGEFKGECKDYFADHDVMVRTAMTQRHRQQGLVESRNYVISRVINYILSVKELESGKTSKDWYKNKTEFRKLIDAINSEIKFKPLKDDKQDNIKLLSNKDADLLPQGTKVRVQLDYPIDVAKNKKLHGTFRAGDIRWSKDVKEIEWNVLQPDQPPMYKVSGERVLRTRNQLLVPLKANAAFV